MIWMPQKDYLQEKYNKRYSSQSGKMYFTVFRIGEKFKNNPNADNLTIDGLRGYQLHVNRECKVDNCDPIRSKFNQLLIGSKNVEQDVMDYLKGVRLRDNSVIARELILSGGDGFWNRLSEADRQKWIDTNIKFLYDSFGSNCIYACLHADESSIHIHTLIVPKFFNEKKGYYQLNNGYYFDGGDKLSEWQDKYTDAMTKEFNNIFMRGIRGSKARHVDLKTYYSLINEDLNTMDAESIKAHAKENYLNKKKVQELQGTLTDNNEMMKACNDILVANRKLKESKKLYEHTIRALADKYKIPQESVIKILNSKKDKDKNNKKQRER